MKPFLIALFFTMVLALGLHFNASANPDGGQPEKQVEPPDSRNVMVTFPASQIISLIHQLNTSAQTPKCGEGSACVPFYRLEGAITDFTALDTLAFMQATKRIKAKALVIEINTPGGSVEEGFRIIKAIEGLGIPVYCVVDNQAMSEGFAIFQACSRRYMTKRSRIMTHRPYLMNVPPIQTIEELEENLHALRTSALGFATHCQRKMRISLAEYNEKVAGLGWHLNPDEALKVGAIDGIIPGSATILGRVRK